jgi:arginine:pyruvate transaminase
MRVASILSRVAGLGSDKWQVHFRARQMLARGESVILLTIGEPDQPMPAELIAATHRALQAGRTGYSNGRGEAPVLQALAAKYSARSGRAVGYILARAYPFPRWTAPPSAQLQSKLHEHRSIP